MKFFRKLRERMLKDNRVAKYFLYAIGEIVLVLIGILLALQINAWKQNKNDKRTIGLHINAILDETNENINELTKVIEKMEFFGRTAEVLLELYESKDFDNPLLENYTYVLYTNRVVTPSSASFENLKNSQEYALIDNFAVKKSLAKAYNTFVNIKMAEEVDKIPKTAFYTDYILPNGFLIGSMPKSESFFSSSYYGNMIMSVRETNKVIEYEAINALSVLEDLQKTLKNYYESLDIGPLRERKNILEYIENGTSIEKIISIVKEQDPDNPKIIFAEYDLNEFGYSLLRENKIEQALNVFKLNVELHPESFNVHDSYGEGLLELGDTLSAIKAYKRSYELNPDNQNKRQVIKDFEEKQRNQKDLK